MDSLDKSAFLHMSFHIIFFLWLRAYSILILKKKIRVITTFMPLLWLGTAYSNYVCIFKYLLKREYLNATYSYLGT